MIWTCNKRSFSKYSGWTRGATRLAFLCLVLLVPASRLILGEEVDRLVVAVNGIAITDGDLELARNLNAIIFYGKTAQGTSRDEAIERQINQELMRQELKNFSMPDEEHKVEARVQALREAYAARGGLAALLRRIGNLLK